MYIIRIDNNMRKDFIFKSMLMIALICLPFAFTSCSNDDDEVTTVSYHMGFNNMSGNMNEMYTIESIYMQALGVSSETFNLTGTISECDSKVASACKNAEKTVAAKSYTGKYLFVITNNNNGKKVYSYQIN